ncbi:MAG: coproporphyrinogen dehydrogenase HemZ [Lachnospiraceae bacterium]
MITISLDEANFEYDIHSLVKSFYPGEEVKIVADKEKIKALEQEKTPLFHMEVSYVSKDSTNLDWDVVRFEIWTPKVTGGIWEDGTYEKQEEAEAKSDFSHRKETKNRLKKALYQMLNRYTNKELPWGTLTGIRPTKIPLGMLEEGIPAEEIRAYMKSTYYATEQKIDLSIDIAKWELELLKPIDYEHGYSLYIGIPFCPSICLYCSFSSSPLGIWKDRVEEYLDALDKEIEFIAKACKNRKLNTVYIGGGTPTTLSPKQLERLLIKIEQSFDFSDLVEYTVEAGRPDSITEEKLLVLRKHNISRISINPQTMKQETLDFIGRHHTVEQTVESFHLARKLGFDNINMDLIVGLPEETIEDVQATMEQIKRLNPDNLTVHSLAVKRAARLRMFQEENKMQLTNSWEIIDLTARYAAEMGMKPYYLYRQKNMAGNFENVGYSKPQKAGIYNILIMEEKQSIMALGAGASSKYVLEHGARIERTENVKDITLYLQRIDEMIERKREALGNI